MYMNEILELQEDKKQDKPAGDNEIFHLCDVEVETARRAAFDRGLPFNPEKRAYTRQELGLYGMVREGYNREELRARGVLPRPVSSLDASTTSAEASLPLETPFGSAIRKYELPIDMLPMRVAKTIFPPGSVVKRHVHPPHTNEDPGGGLRIIFSGKIFFEGREYGPGDWFFVPNGTPYEFTTAPDQDTIVFYKYRFFGAEQGNRFSHPSDV
jgi:hypothetical protein